LLEKNPKERITVNDIFHSEWLLLKYVFKPRNLINREEEIEEFEKLEAENAEKKELIQEEDKKKASPVKAMAGKKVQNINGKGIKASDLSPRKSSDKNVDKGHMMKKLGSSDRRLSMGTHAIPVTKLTKK